MKVFAEDGIADGDVGCLILAGGRSRRMGRPKALLGIGGQSFLSSLEQALVRFRRKYVSTNMQLDEADPSFLQLADDYLDAGPLAGILKGLETTDCEALFVVACDMPLVSESLALAIVEEWTRRKCRMLVVKDSHGRPHPLCGVYAKRLVPEIRAMLDNGKHRVMDFAEIVGCRFVQLNTIGFDDDVVMNINTYDEYLRLVDHGDTDEFITAPIDSHV